LKAEAIVADEVLAAAGIAIPALWEHPALLPLEEEKD
jgi:hypothetical protein